MQNTLHKSTLENGLQIYLKEIHTAPIVSLWLWYDIGARNEVPGKTGLSHWVEHMQFKGTANTTGQEMDHAIARVGGYWNAFTSQDWTTYLETLPANHLELALKIEADRMQNSLFDPPDEVEMERTVILSEREGAENDPLFLLGEATEALAFQTHPPIATKYLGFRQISKVSPAMTFTVITKTTTNPPKTRAFAWLVILTRQQS